jgi:predicted ATP-grasp superfamily ATP-dependent carboligase
VLLLGSDFKALGVARSLGRRGVPVAVLDDLPRSAWFSRYVVKRFRWPGSLLDPALVDFLLGLAARGGPLAGWVLWPAQDDALELVARHHSALAAGYRLVTQPWELVRRAHDKRLLNQVADDSGVVCPRTWYPSGEAALLEMDIQFPAILKPTVSIRLQYASGVKALLANDREELLREYRAVTAVVPPEDVMIQELIPASAQYSVAAFCDGGRVLSAMTARRTRQYPIDFGLSSTFVEAVYVPGLLEPARRLLERLGLTGMIEVEFIEDSRDGLPKVLDVNPRPWGWHTLCIACGLDFPRITYDHALGRPVVEHAPRYGPRWIRLLTDVPGGWQAIRAGRLSPAAYLRSLRGPTVFSVLDLSDPLPALGDLAVAVLRAAKVLRRGGAAASAGSHALEISA